jgi:hypothetical protein
VALSGGIPLLAERELRSRATEHGLTLAGLRHLRSLIEERGRNAWAVGDVLVAAYGAPQLGPHDGSHQRLQHLADELGASWQWLGACRACSAAWPRRERRLSVAWSVHRHLAARPDRFALLDAFCRECQRADVTPSLARLTAFLDDHDADAPGRDAEGRGPDADATPCRALPLRAQPDPPAEAAYATIQTTTDAAPDEPVATATTTVPIRRPGRPRGDPVTRVERLALALPRPDLERLVERLFAALQTAA